MFSKLFWKSPEKLKVAVNACGDTYFTINGMRYEVNLTKLPPDITLNTFIREYVQLTATKYMCLEGGCGVCIVTIKGKHPVTGDCKIWAANSCLTLLNVCADWVIWTCEGIGNKQIGYHAIQRRLAALNGTQCGFCSPAFVMNMYALMGSKHNQVTMEEVESSFGGNICRCTGYRPILDAMKSFASNSNIQLPSEACNDIEDLAILKCPRRCNDCRSKCQKPMRQLTFPDSAEWHWPKTLNELFQIISIIDFHIEYMLVSGNTAHGVYRRSENIKYFIDINGIAELKEHSLSDGLLYLGANLSLTEAMDIFQEVSSQPGFEYCQQLWQHFSLIANVAVRNTGTLAGNIALKKKHKEFPSDIFITFEALDVRVNVNSSISGPETMTLMDYLNRKMHKSVIISFILKDYPSDKYIFQSYKIMPRAQNSQAYVNAALLLKTEMPAGVVLQSRICFGGIAPGFVHALELENLLQGKCFYDNLVVQHSFNLLENSIQPFPELGQSSPEYRKKLACGLYIKFLLINAPQELINERYKSGGPLLKRGLSSGKQIFPKQENKYPLGQPIQKIEAAIQCSGEAKYANDHVMPGNTVHCAFVTATRVRATIEYIDTFEALQMPGVIAFFSAQDIPGDNDFNDPSNGLEKQEVFCSSTVLYYDQPLGIIVAETSDMAQRAASMVDVIYSKADRDKILTLKNVLNKREVNEADDAIIESFEKLELPLDYDSIKATGIFQAGPQYHFTLEPQTCIAVPFEDGLRVRTATQWMDNIQGAISRMLKINSSKVQLEVQRLGGAFGGKIGWSSQVACAASLAAYKLGRPVRFVQSLESMMSSNGKRWACHAEYEFTVNSCGKVIRLKNSFFEDAGCTFNENPIPVFLLPSASNCYELPAEIYEVKATPVKTDAPSSSFCRAPGAVEAIAAMENIMEHIAFVTEKDPVDVRLTNINANNKMRKLLTDFCQSTEYRMRRQEIDKFNLNNRWLKKGLGIALMEFPIGYLGQFSATVSLYHTDGSVVISHGGIEVGQGLNTKVAQVAAYTLGIPLDLINIEASNSLNGANSFTTGGSIASDSLCYVVRKCCNTLNERLQPIRKSMGTNVKWQEIIHAAWSNSINLIASEHYKTGDMQNYHVFGLALTEVQIDILTGNILIKRVDILEDAGESISPNIDIGQVEGGFVMLLGYWLMEDLKYDRRTGQLLTNRTWNYRVPGALDIPIDFRVQLLQGSTNKGGVLSSKSTGEPPCCIAVSVLFAIQHALQSARDDAGLKKEWVRLGAPTTPETILLNAGNEPSMYSLK